ncbi:Putative Ca2+/H+ antiporter, TMEM165/GDT1 family [Caloramator quimbayensis]|uniref:GDT1 family protein n=1 Tax=Caloramator quimbayensis TaxID=1147123 RepID=A0A1T4WQM3_9CLOT|nr:TMEM165/GDT1 family protein [Caloramator quimbayensis]SKA79660.1 Putative Ca2+/H+ antiporter, TMEM165/GDT1 family [Caloramator quimbayensis]
MALLKTFLLVLIAEIGDKTQLMCMAFASRYKVRDVAIGVGIAIFLLNGLAVALGSYLGALIPFNYIKIAAALCFIGFGLWTIKGGDEDEEEEVEKKTNLGPVITIGATFFIAELGDKTQLMTLTLAANFKQPLLVLLGSVLGMAVADSLGIIGAAYLKKYVPDEFMKWGTAIIFFVFGIITLYEAVPENYQRIQYVILILAILALIIYFVGIKYGKKEKIDEDVKIKKD